MANFGFRDPMQGVWQGYQMGNALRQDGARRRAGNALQGGDYTAAAGELYGAGMLEDGSQVQGLGEQRQAHQAAAQKAQQDELLKFTADTATRLADYHRQTGDVNKTLAAFDQMAPQFQQHGESADEIAQVRARLEADPEATLVGLGAGAAKKAGYDVKVVGSELVATGPDGKIAWRYRPRQQVNVAEGGQLIETPEYYAGAGALPGAPPGLEGAGPQGPAIAPSPEPDQPAPAAGGVTVAALDELPARIGGRITSGQRTPQHNAQVGGVPNSKHITNEARDLVPPQGVSMDEFERQVRASVPPGVQVINEGDHIHVEIDGPGTRASAQPQAAPTAGGARVVYSRPKAAKPQGRPATAEEKRAFGIPENVPAQIKPDNTIDVVGGTNAANNNPRKAEADLRKEFNARPEVKEFRDVSTSYNTIKGLFSKPPSAAGDIAAIFAYMKMLDPGSVVREGEFATAQNAAGVPAQVQNLYNRALNGQRLNPKQRADFLAQAESLYGTRSRRYDEIVGEYNGYANDYGLDPVRVAGRPVGQPTVRPGPRPAPPRIGEVRQGYRYKGGNPAQQSSWERAQ